MRTVTTFSVIHFNITLPSVPRCSKWYIFLGFSPPKPLLSPLRATCPAPHILLDLIARIVFGEQYRSLNSSLCSFLHSVVISSLLGPNMLLNTIFSDTLSLLSSRKRRSINPIQNNMQNYSSVCFNFNLLVENWETKNSKHSMVSICS